MIWSWWALLALPVAWFIQNCLHELSHFVFAWRVEGLKPLGFWPYPHFYDDRFWFARYKVDGGGEKREHRWRNITPFWSGFFYTVSFSIMLVLAKEENRIFILPFIIANVVDALFFWWGYIWGSELSDGKRFKRG